MSETRDDQLNVLIIDDDPDVRRLLFEVVNRGEHQAIAVESAEEGLELLPVWTFQVAFIDHNLPGMTGLLIGEYLRRNNPDMMISLITGQPDPQLVKKSRELRIGFIAKPFSVQRIYEILEEYQQEAAERQQRRQKKRDADHIPPIARYADELTACFAMPNVPSRIEKRLSDTIKRALNDLRSVNRYTERDRIIALSGLLTAKVLGVDLPKGSSGTLYEEYDQLMCLHGRRTEFEEE